MIRYLKLLQTFNSRNIVNPRSLSCRSFACCPHQMHKSCVRTGVAALDTVYTEWEVNCFMCFKRLSNRWEELVLVQFSPGQLNKRVSKCQSIQKGQSGSKQPRKPRSICHLLAIQCKLTPYFHAVVPWSWLYSPPPPSSWRLRSAFLRFPLSAPLLRQTDIPPGKACPERSKGHFSLSAD